MASPLPYEGIITLLKIKSNNFSTYFLLIYQHILWLHWNEAQAVGTNNYFRLERMLFSSFFRQTFFRKYSQLLQLSPPHALAVDDSQERALGE